MEADRNQEWLTYLLGLQALSTLAFFALMRWQYSQPEIEGA